MSYWKDKQVKKEGAIEIIVGSIAMLLLFILLPFLMAILQ